jgi:integrase
MSAYAERRKGKLTGKWIGETVIAGDRFRKRFDSKKEAERWADLAKITGAPPKDPSAPSRGVTFADVVQQAREASAVWARNRDPSGQQRLDYVTAFIGPDTPIADVTTAMLDKLVADLRKRPGKKGKMTLGTINRYLTMASSILTFAQERGHITAVPKVPWQAEQGRRFLWNTEEQEAAIVAFMQAQGWGPSALAFRVLSASGMRWGEFKTLEAEQVDIRNDIAWVRLWKTKTDSPRSVPIDVELARELRDLLASGGVPKYYTFRRNLKAALESAGQSEDFSVHALRHTTATRLIQEKVPLPVVMKFLGHKSVSTTMRYVHVADEDLATASKKISPHAGQSQVSEEEPEEILQ